MKDESHITGTWENGEHMWILAWTLKESWSLVITIILGKETRKFVSYPKANPNSLQKYNRSSESRLSRGNAKPSQLSSEVKACFNSRKEGYGCRQLKGIFQKHVKPHYTTLPHRPEIDKPNLSTTRVNRKKPHNMNGKNKRILERPCQTRTLLALKHSRKANLRVGNVDHLKRKNQAKASK